MTEIGEIPADWDVGAVSSYYDVGSSKRVFQSQWRTRGVPFYRARDIVGFNNGEDKAIGGLYIDWNLYEEYKRVYGVPGKGDLLVTAVGTLGKVFLVLDESPFYFKDGNIIWFKKRGEFESRFLATLFLSGFLDNQIYDSAGGSTVGTYTILNASKTIIPVPPFAEQKAIAEALSDVDALIAAQEELIEKKRAIKQGAMQELLGIRNEGRGIVNEELGVRNCEAGAKKVPRRRLPGFSGEWVEKRLGDCGAVIRGVSYKPYQSYYESGCRRTMLLRSNNIKENVLNYDDLVYVDDECIGEEQLMRCGDILICAANGSRNLVGKSAILKVINNAITFGAFMAIFRTNSNSVDSFVGYLLQSESYRKQLDDILTGSAINNLNARDILSLLFFMPPTLAEQKAIAEVLSDMDAQIEALEAKRAKYESIKQGMMQELLTGKTRLV
jgi:type I restriction enzyme S subunit